MQFDTRGTKANEGVDPLADVTASPVIRFADIACREASAAERKALFDGFSRSAFRLECLPIYSVESEREQFDAYLRGDSSANTGNRQWVDYVSNRIAEGKEIARVHIIPRDLTDYLRFEIDWCYSCNANAGESVRFIFEDELPNELSPRKLADFWLFDDEAVLIQRYGDDGRWLRSDILTDPDQVQTVCELRDRLIALSFPLTELAARLNG